jgi:hypothetical protein
LLIYTLTTDVVFSTFLANGNGSTFTEWDPIGDLLELETNSGTTISSSNVNNSKSDNIFSSNSNAAGARRTTTTTTATTTTNNSKIHFLGSPHSLVAVPIYSTLSISSSKQPTTTTSTTNTGSTTNDEDDHRPVAYLFNIIAWWKYLPQSIPLCTTGTVVIIKNTCGDSATFIADDGKVSFFSSKCLFWYL